MCPTILEGWCDGGPWAGRQLAGYTQHICVQILGDADRVPRAIDYDRNDWAIRVRYGLYAFDEGAWRWREP